MTDRRLVFCIVWSMLIFAVLAVFGEAPVIAIFLAIGALILLLVNDRG
jgi:hypothetical protein